MDRWSGREDDDAVRPGPQGKVARLGIGAFVKQDAGACLVQPGCRHPAASSSYMSYVTRHRIAGPVEESSVSTGSGKIEVVASRRQQKQARAAAAMPPPPAKLATATLASQPAAPAWAGTPPSGFFLEVQKNGEQMQQIELLHPCTLFGRSFILELLTLSELVVDVC